MTFVNDVKNPYEGWLNLAKLFLSTDENLIHDGEYITYDGVIVSTIRNPTTKIHKNPKYGEGLAEEYCKQMVEGTENDFVYTYHDRLYNYNGVNQIQYIIDELKRDSKSRRAEAITWMPKQDYNPNPPCMQFIKCLIENGKLNMECMFRSHDMFSGWYTNVLALTALMEEITKELEVNIGKLTVVSLSGHVYIKRDLQDMRRVLSSQ